MKKVFIFLSMIIIVCVCFALFNKVSLSGEDLGTKTYNKEENKNTNSNKVENKKQEQTKEQKSNKEKEDKKTYSQIKTISFAEFEKLVNEQPELIVIVSSSACSHCLNFEPVVDKVLKEINGVIYRLDILSLTVPDKAKLDTYYTITGTPTLIAIKNKNVVDASSGEKTEAGFKEWYQKQFK